MKIEVHELSFAYGVHSVLDHVTFTTGEGEFLSVLGPNGVGKSTLFRCMLGILTPSNGQILVNGKDVSAMSPACLAQQIAYIPQSHDPVFHYSVFDMVLMGTTAQRGIFSPPGREQKKLVEAALDRLGLSDLQDRSYRTLSGGERQLVLIARAIAQKARILLMDEPSASLDFGNRIRVMEQVKELCKEGYCVIQTTHDPEQAYLYSDAILALKNGRILAHGKPRDIFNEVLISDLYGVEVEICKIKQDALRVCIPKGVLT